MKKRAFADLHQHLLWGLDDGPDTPKRMHALLRQNARQGVAVICATVHADPRRSPVDWALYQKRLAAANAYCAKHHLPIQILPGSEVRYRDAAPDLLADGKLLPLGNSRYVLIEFPEGIDLASIEGAADSLYRAGYRPILAHVERCRRLIRSPKRAMALREEYGILYQMNCNTVLRPRGLRTRYFVWRMLRERAIDLIASDAHDADARPVQMRAAYKCIAERYGTAYARRLMCGGGSLLGIGREQ